MKNNVIKGFAGIAVLLGASQAYAATDKNAVVRQESHPMTYVSADVGGAMPQHLTGAYYQKKTPKSSLFYQAGIGREYNKYFRWDVSLSRVEKIKFSKQLTLSNLSVFPRLVHANQEFSSTALMLNGYGIITQYHGVEPYIQAGLGASNNAAKPYKIPGIGSFKGDSRLEFAWSLGLGADYKATKNMSVGLSYKYLNLGKAYNSKVLIVNNKPSVVGNAPSTKLAVHALTLGAKYHF